LSGAYLLLNAASYNGEILHVPTGAGAPTMCRTCFWILCL